jgi:glutaredoxin 3
MYSTLYCPYCMAARQFLDSKSIDYIDIGIDGMPELREEMMSLSGRHTVPQIWVGETHIGGFDEMRRLEMQGKFDALLATA